MLISARWTQLTRRSAQRSRLAPLGQTFCWPDGQASSRADRWCTTVQSRLSIVSIQRPSEGWRRQWQGFCLQIAGGFFFVKSSIPREG